LATIAGAIGGLLLLAGLAVLVVVVARRPRTQTVAFETAAPEVSDHEKEIFSADQGMELEYIRSSASLE
jgi:hypothetical protein